MSWLSATFLSLQKCSWCRKTEKIIWNIQKNILRKCSFPKLLATMTSTWFRTILQLRLLRAIWFRYYMPIIYNIAGLKLCVTISLRSSFILLYWLTTPNLMPLSTSLSPLLTLWSSMPLTQSISGSVTAHMNPLTSETDPSWLWAQEPSFLGYLPSSPTIMAIQEQPNSYSKTIWQSTETMKKCCLRL